MNLQQKVNKKWTWRHIIFRHLVVKISLFFWKYRLLNCWMIPIWSHVSIFLRCANHIWGQAPDYLNSKSVSWPIGVSVTRCTSIHTNFTKLVISMQFHSCVHNTCEGNSGHGTDIIDFSAEELLDDRVDWRDIRMAKSWIHRQELFRSLHFFFFLFHLCADNGTVSRHTSDMQQDMCFKSDQHDVVGMQKTQRNGIAEKWQMWW